MSGLVARPKDFDSYMKNTDTERDNSNPLSALEEWFKALIRQEIQAMVSSIREEDRLLTTDEAAKVLSVSPDWLYRKASKLPFTKKLGPKMLRFSSQGIQKYLAARKIS